MNQSQGLRTNANLKYSFQTFSGSAPLRIAGGMCFGTIPAPRDPKSYSAPSCRGRRTSSMLVVPTLLPQMKMNLWVCERIIASSDLVADPPPLSLFELGGPD